VDRIAAIIFDMDGVLVDSEPAYFDATRLVLSRHGIPYTEADDQEFFGFTGLEVFRILRLRHGLRATEAELLQQRTDLLLRLIREHLVPMPGVPDVPRQLGEVGHRLALASSAVPEVIGVTLKGLGLSGVFETVISGADVTHGKPAPEIFLETARRLAVQPEECLVVEDSRNGILAASAAGMRCVAIPCASTRNQNLAQADFRLDRLTELPALLAAIGGKPVGRLGKETTR